MFIMGLGRAIFALMIKTITYLVLAILIPIILAHLDIFPVEKAKFEFAFNIPGQIPIYREIYDQNGRCETPNCVDIRYSRIQYMYNLLIAWVFSWLVVIPTIVVAIVATMVVLYRMKLEFREYISIFLDTNSLSPPLPYKLVRSTFHSTVIPKIRVSEAHNHGLSASLRASASCAMDYFGSTLGLRAYFYQQSASDVELGRVGSRSYYWSKDLTVQAEKRDMMESEFCAIVDTDYYYDMNQELAWNSNQLPVIVYTVQPKRASYTSKEYTYTFTEDNQLHYIVTGGATYKHEVWDYNVDNVFVSRTWYGIPYLTQAYLVDRLAIDDTHELVCFTPTRRFRGIAAFISSLLMGSPLKRLTPVVDTKDGKFTRLYVQSPEGLYVSTGRPNSYASTYISAASDAAIADVSNITVNAMLPAQVQSFYPREAMAPDGEAKIGAPVLTRYHRAMCAHKIPYVFPVNHASRVYEFDVHHISSKPSMVAFMSPFIHEGYNPASSLSSDVMCVTGRILKFQKDKQPELTPFLHKLMVEFVELLVPKELAHTGIPVDMDTVWQNKPRPMQRKIMEEAVFLNLEHVAQLFTKKEAYAKIADPRPITNYHSRMKLDYSSYIMSLSMHVLKKQQWYASGKTPLEIANRVVEICTQAAEEDNDIDCSDLHRMDGHIKAVMRLLEHMLGMRYFRVEFQPTFVELHNKQFDVKVTTTHGLKYNSGTARGSGSEETSDHNTLDNAFIQYVANRMTKKNGQYLTAEQAFSRLGIYLGDDGLGLACDAKAMHRAAKALGQEVEVSRFKVGDIGVNFLARIYGPYVWYGDNTSHCDILRHLKKLHLTVTINGVSPKQKWLEKMRAFEMTDANTPVIGDLVAVTRMLHPGEILMDENLWQMRHWNSVLTKDVQYPNQGEWIEANCREILNNYGFNYDAFRSWLREVTSFEFMLAPPLMVDPPGPQTQKDVVVDGHVHLGVEGPLEIPTMPHKYEEPKIEEHEREIRDKMVSEPKWMASTPPFKTRKDFYLSGYVKTEGEGKLDKPKYVVVADHPILKSVQVLKYSLIICCILSSFNSFSFVEGHHGVEVADNYNLIIETPNEHSIMKTKKVDYEQTIEALRSELAALKRDQTRTRKEEKKAKQSVGAVIQGIGKEVIPKGTFSAGGSMLGSAAGGALGTYFGGPAVGTIASKAVGALGKLLGDGLASVVGFGDYQVSSNNLYKSGAVLPEGQQIPVFRNVGYATRIQHREFVGNVVSPTTPTDFSNIVYEINPANKSLFPWLSTVANAFQQYKLKGMLMEFRTMSSDFSFNSALGTVALATNYNVTDDPFGSLLEMQNSQYATSSKPSLSHIHAVECDPAEVSTSMLYVRTPQSYSVSDQDARLYDLGLFQIATQGLAATAGAIIGQLWISYDIELYKPLLPDDAARCFRGWGQGALVSKTNIFGAIQIQRGGAALIGPPLPPNQIQFLVPGSYLVTAQVNGVSVNGMLNFFSTTNPTSHGATNQFFQINTCPPGGYHDAIFSSGIWAAVIRAENGYIHDFTSQAALAGAVSYCEINVVPCDFTVQYGPGYAVAVVENSTMYDAIGTSVHAFVDKVRNMTLEGVRNDKNMAKDDRKQLTMVLNDLDYATEAIVNAINTLTPTQQKEKENYSDTGKRVNVEVKNARTLRVADFKDL